MNKIKVLPEKQALTLWNNFVQKNLQLTPFSFNPSLYYFYKKHFNWKPYYILVFEGDEVCAVLPLINTGKAWVSLPHFSYGGLLFSDTSPYSHTIIIDNIISEIKDNELQSGFYSYDLNNQTTIEKKHAEKVFIRSINNKEQDGFIKSEKVTSVLQLPKNASDLDRMLNSNLNRKINKAKNSGIIIKTGDHELLADFYYIYTHNIYKLKSLSYSKKFFKDLMETFKYGDIKIFVAYKNDKVVGTGMLAFYNGFYENMFFATSTDSRKYYVSDLLHWEMINYSINKNNESKPEREAYYSFGRSTISSGVHKYKSHWPVTDYPLFVYSNMGDIRKHKWLSQIWRLLPFAISKPLGGYLIRHIY